MRRVAGAAVTCALLAFVVLAWPARFGGRIGYVIVAGHSMTGTYNLGDLLLVHSKEQYQVGDVVVYRVPGTGPGAGIPVVHRLVSGSPRAGFHTKGDANQVDDPWVVRKDNIEGAVFFRIPQAGVVLHFATSPLGWATFIGVLVVIAVYRILAADDPEHPADDMVGADPPAGPEDEPGPVDSVAGSPAIAAGSDGQAAPT